MALLIWWPWSWHYLRCLVSVGLCYFNFANVIFSAENMTFAKLLISVSEAGISKLLQPGYFLPGFLKLQLLKLRLFKTLPYKRRKSGAYFWLQFFRDKSGNCYCWIILSDVIQL